jgi:TetR/AcrR family transcriptional regulator
MAEAISVEKEKLIVNAARKRFARYGFSKVTMDEIAGDIEMGKASLYYYFPAKEDLFKAVIQQEQEEFKKNIEKILEKAISASEKLLDYVEQRMKFYRELLNLGSLSAHNSPSHKSIYHKLFADFEKVELKLVKKIFDEGKVKNEFNHDLGNDTPEVFLHVLRGLKWSVVKSSGGSIEDKEIQLKLQKEMKCVTNLIINGIKKR